MDRKIIDAKIEFYEDEHGEECDEISAKFEEGEDYVSLGKFISYGIHKRCFDPNKMIGLTEKEGHEYINQLTDPWMKPWLERRF